MATLHEVPFGLYYGSVDSTPLFVILAGRYAQATGDLDTLRSLWPAIERALGWVDGPGDRDHDGTPMGWLVHGAANRWRGFTLASN